MARTRGDSPKNSPRRGPPAGPAPARASGGGCEGEHGHRISRDAPITEDAFERAAAIFRAAGDVARLKLLARLAYGEWCVTELAEAAGVGLSTVSQQLRLLRGEKLVHRRRAGKHIYYSLSDTHVFDLVQSVLAHASEPVPLRAPLRAPPRSQPRASRGAAARS